MPITEGNPSTSFDPAIAGQTVSPYQQVLQKLAADPENSKETLAAMDEMIRSHGQVQANSVVEVVRQQNEIRRAIDILGDELDRVMEADEDLKRFRKPVELLVKSEFEANDGDPTHAENVKKLMAGTLGKPEIREMVKKHLNDLAGDTTTKKGLSGMKTEGNSQTAAAQTATGSVGTRKELNEPQRQVYDAKIAEWNLISAKDRQRLGLPLTDEEMHTKALASASSKFKEGLQE